MKTFPLFTLGCLLALSAISLPLRAQDAGGSLTLSSGGATFNSAVSGSMTLNTGEFSVYSGGNYSNGVLMLRSNNWSPIGGTIALGTGTLIYSGTLVSNVTGTILSGGSLTLANAANITSQYSTGGTLILSGANTYTGTTTISGGVLALNTATNVVANAVNSGALLINASALSASAPTISIRNDSSVPLVLTAPAPSPADNGAGFTTQFIPEPSSIALLLCGVPLFGRRSRRK